MRGRMNKISTVDGYEFTGAVHWGNTLYEVLKWIQANPPNQQKNNW